MAKQTGVSQPQQCCFSQSKGLLESGMEIRIDQYQKDILREFRSSEVEITVVNVLSVLPSGDELSNPEENKYCLEYSEWEIGVGEKGLSGLGAGIWH